MAGQPENLLSLWADRLAEALAVGGVREVVVSPGSRNTPFLLALARREDLALSSVIDERAAAFLALARARRGGRPVGLLCTSGSAPAHYYPAVLEASESGAPLVILSADRPPELQGSGAPQTVDQQGLFGPHVRAFLDLGLPDPTDRALLALSRRVQRTLAAGSGPWPGPVHLNAPARKPLEPEGASSPAARALAERVGRLPTLRPIHAAGPTGPSAAALDALVQSYERAERPAIVVGPRALGADRASLSALAPAASLWVEAGSQMRFLGPGGPPRAFAFDLWLRDPRAPRPDFVLELGRTPVSAAYGRWLDGDGPATRFCVTPHLAVDPSHRGEIVVGDPATTLRAFAARIGEGRMAPSWRAEIESVEDRAWSLIDTAAQGWCEGAAVRAAIQALPAGATLALGNSLPVRHADRWARDGARGALEVYTSRGVNGIDGWLAQVAGLGVEAPAPVLAILGDVTFAHDLGSLALLARSDAPVVVLVLDNGGGRIFEQLPLFDRVGASGTSGDRVSEATFARFTTPTGLDAGAVAAACGLAVARPARLADLDEALAAALARPGATVVHARFEGGDAARREKALREQIQAGEVRR